MRRLLALLLLCTWLPARAEGLPELGDVSDATLSETQERTVGNRIMRDVRSDPAFVDDPEIADYIKSIGARLLAAADGPRRDIEYFVVQDETVNAFALIGGHVGVQTGLLLLTQNESELAGVLGHETAHILQRHQARLYASQGKYQLASLAALALAIIASRSGSSSSGQMTEAAVVGASALSIQGQLDYTREHEREADRVGLVLMQRAGFDPRGMETFFDRMMRNNRLNELKGAPSYLRTHPLTTERHADMQSRIENNAERAGTALRMVPDSFDYRLAKAKIRAGTGSATEAVAYFRNALADKTVTRPREEVFGLALALRRLRDFPAAERELATIRAVNGDHPAFEWLAAQLKIDQKRDEEALAIYRSALKAFPGHRSLQYGYVDLLLSLGRRTEALAALEERLRTVQDDPRLYELQAKAFEASGKRVSQHRSQAEAYFRRGNLAAAVDQLELAVKVRGSDFYEQSMAESRLQQLRFQLDNEKAAEKALKIS